MPVRSSEDCHTCHMTEPISLAELIRTHPLRSTNPKSPVRNGEVRTSSLSSRSARPPGRSEETVFTNGSTSSTPPPPPPPPLPPSNSNKNKLFLRKSTDSSNHKNVQYAKPMKRTKFMEYSDNSRRGATVESDESVQNSDIDPRDSFLHSPRLQRMIIQPSLEPDYEVLENSRSSSKNRSKKSSLKSDKSRPKTPVRTSSTSSDRSVHFDLQDSIQKRPILPASAASSFKLVSRTLEKKSSSTSDARDTPKTNAPPTVYSDAQVQTYDVAPRKKESKKGSGVTGQKSSWKGKVPGYTALATLLGVANSADTSNCCSRKRVLVGFLIAGYCLMMVLTIVIGVAVTHFNSDKTNALQSSNLKAAGLVPGSAVAESSRSIRARLQNTGKQSSGNAFALNGDDKLFTNPPFHLEDNDLTLTVDQTRAPQTFPSTRHPVINTNSHQNRDQNDNFLTPTDSSQISTKTVLPEFTNNFLEPVKKPTKVTLPSDTQATSFRPKVRPMLHVEIQPENTSLNSLTRKTDEPRDATIVRSWSSTNSDGTFSYGYLNSDGSYKNETRGNDCVVRGIFGYIDKETGSHLSFPYTSGNPCTPEFFNNQKNIQQRPPLTTPQTTSRPQVFRPTTPTIIQQQNEVQPTSPLQQTSPTLLRQSGILRQPPQLTQQQKIHQKQQQFLQQKKQQELIQQRILQEQLQRIRNQNEQQQLLNQQRQQQLNSQNQEIERQRKLQQQRQQRLLLQQRPVDPPVQQNQNKAQEQIPLPTQQPQLTRQELLQHQIQRHNQELQRHQKALQQQLRVQRLQRIQLLRSQKQQELAENHQSSNLPVQGNENQVNLQNQRPIQSQTHPLVNQQQGNRVTSRNNQQLRQQTQSPILHQQSQSAFLQRSQHNSRPQQQTNTNQLPFSRQNPQIGQQQTNPQTTSFPPEQSLKNQQLLQLQVQAQRELLSQQQRQQNQQIQQQRALLRQLQNQPRGQSVQ